MSKSAVCVGQGDVEAVPASESLSLSFGSGWPKSDGGTASSSLCGLDSPRSDESLSERIIRRDRGSCVLCDAWSGLEVMPIVAGTDGTDFQIEWLWDRSVLLVLPFVNKLTSNHTTRNLKEEAFTKTNDRNLITGEAVAFARFYTRADHGMRPCSV